jgi:hypothetical protein
MIATQNYRLSMKKTFSVIIFIFLSTGIKASSYCGIKTAEKIPMCEELNKKDFKNKEPGRYYYTLALCNVASIHDEQSFDCVINLFNKSIKYDYLVSYIALAELYFDKYRVGSMNYGVKGIPEDLSLAIYNYERAAALGSVVAQRDLGQIYSNKWFISSNI